MNRRFVLAGLGLAAVVAALWTVSQSSAQRERPGDPRPEGLPAIGVRVGPMHQAGRFICAYGSAEKVLVLDTATGQVYSIHATEFKSAADLAKVRDMPALPIERRPGEDRRDPIRRDGDRPREGDPARPRDEDRPKEGLKGDKERPPVKEKKKDRPPFEKDG
jgi:hypothetical protein